MPLQDNDAYYGREYNAQAMTIICSRFLSALQTRGSFLLFMGGYRDRCHTEEEKIENVFGT